MFEVGDFVKAKHPDLEEQGELLSAETVNILKALDFTGEITQIQDGLFYVGFVHETLGWVTQVFEEDEIEAVE